MTDPFDSLVRGLGQDAENLETMLYRYVRQAGALRDLVASYTQVFRQAEMLLQRLFSRPELSQIEAQAVYDTTDAIREVRRQTEVIEREIEDGRMGLMTSREAVRLGLLPDPETVSELTRRRSFKRRRPADVDWRGILGTVDTSEIRD